LPRIQTTLAPAQLTGFLAQRDATTLTDDHVPVEQLLAPVFRQRLHESLQQSGPTPRVGG
jgi:hypothetical protein